MRHTRQTKVPEDQSQSHPPQALHPHQPHTGHIRLPLSLAHSLTISIYRTTTTNTHINNSHAASLAKESERGQLCPTSGRCKGLKSRVSHSLRQHCIHTIHTQLTSDHSHTLSLTHTINPHQPSHKTTHWKE